jgi:Domain of unknown function (DUF4402)
MKNQIKMKKIAFFVLAAICFSVNANAQTPSTATANVNANIVQPIVITKVQDMVFSDIAVTGGGTVTLGLTNNLSTSGAGVSLPATSAPFSAVFNVTGSAGYLYTYSVPANFNLVHSITPANTIAVSAITSTYDGSAHISTLNGSGADVVKFGATITLAANQAPGFYANTTAFAVTVNYN